MLFVGWYISWILTQFQGRIEHSRPPDMSGFGGWNLGLSGVGFCNFFSILLYYKPFYWWNMPFLSFSWSKSGLTKWFNTPRLNSNDSWQASSLRTNSTRFHVEISIAIICRLLFPTQAGVTIPKLPVNNCACSCTGISSQDENTIEKPRSNIIITVFPYVAPLYTCMYIIKFSNRNKSNQTAPTYIFVNCILYSKNVVWCYIIIKPIHNFSVQK